MSMLSTMALCTMTMHYALYHYGYALYAIWLWAMLARVARLSVILQKISHSVILDSRALLRVQLFYSSEIMKNVFQSIIVICGTFNYFCNLLNIFNRQFFFRF